VLKVPLYGPFGPPHRVTSPINGRASAMSAMDRRVAFAAEVADARRGTAEAIMKLEKKLDREEERESTQREEWLVELRCLKNKLQREEQHLNMVLEVVFAEGSKAPSPFPPTGVCALQ